MDAKFPNVLPSGVELAEDRTVQLLAMAGYTEHDGVWYDASGFPMPIRMLERWGVRKESRKYHGKVYDPWPELNPLADAETDVDVEMILDDCAPSMAAKMLAVSSAEAEDRRLRADVQTEYRDPVLRTELQQACMRLATHHVRAADAGVLSTLTPAEWLSIRDSFLGRCAYCDRRSMRLALEHVVPIARAGHNAAENVVAACAWCNSSKNSHDAHEWMIRVGYDPEVVFQRVAEARARAVAS